MIPNEGLKATTVEKVEGFLFEILMYVVWGCYCRVINKTKIDLENGLDRVR